jgi:CRP/FNR family transcriptional regulator, cyclic AMP receptor protein
VGDLTLHPVDVLGYAAAALVLLAFSLQSLIALRTVAIASNLVFIAYAMGAHLHPVLVLHAALLPVNLWRLRQCLSGTGSGAKRRQLRAVPQTEIR